MFDLPAGSVGDNKGPDEGRSIAGARRRLFFAKRLPVARLCFGDDAQRAARIGAAMEELGKSARFTVPAHDLRPNMFAVPGWRACRSFQRQMGVTDHGILFFSQAWRSLDHATQCHRRAGSLAMTVSPLTHLLPANMPPPFAAYSHGVLVRAGSDLLFCSGQLGIGPDAHVPEAAEAQAELCFTHVGLLLAAAGMGFGDVVRINAFVTNRTYMRPYMAVRDRLFPAPSPASTLMIVTGFTREAFKVEVEVIAARNLALQALER